MIGSTTIGACANNPYQAACANAGFNNIRSARVDYCSGLGSDVTRLNLVQTDDLCYNDGTIDAIDAVCDEGYIGKNGVMVVANPFATICGTEYAVQRGLACIGKIDAKKTEPTVVVPSTCGTTGIESSNGIPTGDILAYCLTNAGLEDDDCGSNLDRSCLETPFQGGCEAAKYNDARQATCIENPQRDTARNENDRCPSLIAPVLQ